MNENIVKAFIETSRRYDDFPCAHVEKGGGWISISWMEMRHKILSLAHALSTLGLKKGDAVILFGKTRYEWVVADFAIMALGAISVPVYQSFKSERLCQIIKDSGAKFAVVEDSELLAIAEAALAELKPYEKVKIVTIERASGYPDIEALISAVEPSEARKIEAVAASLSDDDVATYVYTSGTTGALKGVVLTHKNLISEVRSVEGIFDFTIDHIGLLWLPLAHVLGRMMEVFQFVHGCQTAFANDINRLPEIYQEIHPHFVCGVPRMLEKIHARVDEYISGKWVVARWVFEWAFDAGRDFSKLDQKHRRVPFSLRLKFLAARILIFSKLKKRLGGRLECFVCGGARLKKDVARFFHSVGITVLEGYGLTETFAAITVNRKDDFHFGTVGKPVPGTEIRISADGEILVKGPTVFKEYLNSPDETKAAFTRDGWFKTGDLGEYSRDGFLRITGRRKEMIITAGGKNIVPTMIEELLVKSPYVEHAMVYGDDRPYLTAIVTLSEQDVRSHLEKLGLNADIKIPLSSIKEVRALVQRHLEEVNSKLVSFETIKKMEIVDGSFTIDGGELTPTMKLRRGYVADKYHALIDSMY